MERLKRRTIRNQNDLVRAVEACVPIPRELPITKARLLRAYRAVLVEGFSAVFAVLAWTEARLELAKLAEPRPRPGHMMAKTTGGSDANEVSVVLPSTLTMFTVRGVGVVPYPLSATFTGCVADAMYTALESANTLAKARTGTTDHGYELIAAGVRATIETSFLRKLLEEPLMPIAAFMLGHRPFTAPHVTTSTILQWARSLAARTYEGAPIKTGLVVEARPGVVRRLPDVGVAQFDTPVEFADLDGQQLVLADGERRFLIVSPSRRVTGVAYARGDLSRRSGTTSLPLSALWVQAKGPEMLRLFGSTQSVTFQFAQIKHGVLQLYSRQHAEERLTELLRSVVNAKHGEHVHGVARTLLERAEDGHGGGVVFGTRKDFGGRRLKEPVHVSDDTWSSFLNPDGAVVIDQALHLREYRVILPQPKSKLLPHRGTRHNALAFASVKSKRVAIAISDDGSLTAFKNGKVAFAIG